MRTRTFVLIGIGLTLLSSLFLGLAQVYAMYKFEIYAGMGWTEFIRWHAWRPGLEIWGSINGIPNDIFDPTVGWFLLSLPGVVLLVVFHPFRKPQKVVLGVLVLLTIIDLCWLLLGWGVYIAAPNENYVACVLHLGFSVLSLFSAVPLGLAVREELRREKQEGRE